MGPVPEAAAEPRRRDFRVAERNAASSASPSHHCAIQVAPFPVLKIVVAPEARRCRIGAALFAQ